MRVSAMNFMSRLMGDSMGNYKISLSLFLAFENNKKKKEREIKMKKLKSAFSHWLDRSACMTPTCMIPMKRMVLMLMLACSMCLGANAAVDNDKTYEVKNVEDYRFNVNMRSLSRTLNLTEEQKSFVEGATSEFERNMLFAATVENGESRKMVVRNTVIKNYDFLRCILDKEQYRKYLAIMNITLKHRGFIR
jgi:hypothetical protein